MGEAKFLGDRGWEPYEPEPTCDAKRGPRSRTFCELPPDHETRHEGRSPTGRWYSWPAVLAEIGPGDE